MLIHGASGGVGVFAVQLAHDRGAHIFATASARNRDFVKQLGANEFIDYTSQRFDDIASDIDVVFDASAAKPSIVPSASSSPAAPSLPSPPAKKPEAVNDERKKNAFFIVEPNQNQLIEVTKLIEAAS